MRSNENHDGRRLAEIVAARQWQLDWLQAYVASGGVIYDTITKRWIGREEVRR